MNTKRIMRWVIVLFLFAALPVMSAVMAQGQEPAVDQPPIAPANQVSVDESTACSGTPIGLDELVFGRVYKSDPDRDSVTYSFYVPTSTSVLVYLRNTNSDGPFPFRGDGHVSLELSAGGYNETWLKDYPALLYRGLEVGTHCITVTSISPGSWWGSQTYQDYELAVSSRPLLVSATTGGTVAEIVFFQHDILVHFDLNGGQERWERFFNANSVRIFDGSRFLTVNVRNISNVAFNGQDEILLGFNAIQTLPGVGQVTPQDIVVFDPIYGQWQSSGYGIYVYGTFHWGMRGSEHQLTTSGEKLDAIEGFTMGIESDPAYRGCFGFPVSTAGVAIVNGPFGATKQDDEDVFCKVYNPNYGGWQHWDWFFDVNGKNDAPASEPAPGTVRGLPGEDVTAMAYNDNTDTMYLTIQGTGNILGHAVSQKDIFAINYPSYSWGSVVWHGPDHGWNYNIDAIEYNPN